MMLVSCRSGGNVPSGAPSGCSTHGVDGNAGMPVADPLPLESQQPLSPKNAESVAQPQRSRRASLLAPPPLLGATREAASLQVALEVWVRCARWVSNEPLFYRDAPGAGGELPPPGRRQASEVGRVGSAGWRSAR